MRKSVEKHFAFTSIPRFSHSTDRFTRTRGRSTDVLMKTETELYYSKQVVPEKDGGGFALILSSRLCNDGGHKTQIINVNAGWDNEFVHLWSEVYCSILLHDRGDMRVMARMLDVKQALLALPFHLDLRSSPL